MNLSYTVNFKGQAVNSTVINDCIQLFNTFKSEDDTILNIVAENEILQFDFSLIGHFILFKQALPNLQIKLQLIRNYPDANVDKSVKSIIWKLRQYMIHAYYSTHKSIFILIDANGEISEAISDKQKGSRFELSEKYLPIIFLTKSNYSSLFVEQSRFESISKLNLLNKIDEEGLYQACRKYLFAKVKDENYALILSQLSFYHSLQWFVQNLINRLVINQI